MSTDHTPGPHRFERDAKWPFHPRIVDATGATLVSAHAEAFSSSQRSRADFDAAVGFDRKDVAGVIAANEQQAANFTLWAAASDLLAALRGVLRVADRATDEFDAARAAVAKATEAAAIATATGSRSGG